MAPPGSDAVALIAMLVPARNVESFVGEVIATDGAGVELTVIPMLSIAIIWSGLVVTQLSSAHRKYMTPLFASGVANVIGTLPLLRAVPCVKLPSESAFTLVHSAALVPPVRL